MRVVDKSLLYYYFFSTILHTSYMYLATNEPLETHEARVTWPKNLNTRTQQCASSLNFY